MTVHECRDRSRMLGSYLDGELEPAMIIEIDEHVASCDTCREEAQLLRAMRGSLKRVVRTSAPSGLRERMAAAMTAERAREDVRAEEANARSKAPSWRTMVPLATAAALALVWGAASRFGSPSRSAHAGLEDEMLADLVYAHSQQPLPLDAKDEHAVRDLGQYVGVPVHPAPFERAGAHLVGGRVVPLRTQGRAAMLQYLVGSGGDERRVSVIVYDPQKIQIGTSLEPYPVGTAEVRVGREKGYSVAAAQHDGVGYLVASDLDTDKSAQLAAVVYEDLQ